MFTHDIDPVITTFGGVHVWWYGLSYSLGFLNAHFFVRRHRRQIGLSLRAVLDLSLLLTVGVLAGGRLVEIVCYEWQFYREHPQLAPAFWLGGMATHGLMLGGLLGVWAFARFHRRSFLEMADLLAIPAAFILGVGRFGNFIDGQIVGSVTSAWWAVKFPDADGFRHPVVLYDGLKNLLIIPLLVLLAPRRPPTGVLTGVFLFLYAFLRIFVDLFREYPTTLLGLATGQSLNIAMSLGGLALWFARRNAPRPARFAAASEETSRGLGWRRVAFAALLLFSLAMPSDWTQDVPDRYGKRHAGLVHSSIYPPIDRRDMMLGGVGGARIDHGSGGWLFSRPMKVISLSAILFGFILPLASAKEETEVPFGQCPAPVQAMIKQNAQQVRGTIEKVEKEKTKDSEFYDAKIAGADGRHWSLKVLPDGKVLEWKEKKAKKDKN